MTAHHLVVQLVVAAGRGQEGVPVGHEQVEDDHDLEADGEDVHLLDQTGLVARDELEQGDEGGPELLPGIPEPNSGSLLVGQEPVDDGEGVEVELLGESLHHVGADEFNLEERNRSRLLRCQAHSQVSLFARSLTYHEVQDGAGE